MSKMNGRKYTESCECYLRCVECSALYVVEAEELEGSPRVVGCSTCLHEWYASEDDLLWGEDEVLDSLGGEEGVKSNAKAVNERVAAVVEDRSDGGGIIIFVGNLSYRATDADLYRAFSGYGVVVKCQVPSHVSGASKGYGFVEMRSREAGMRAIAELQGTSIMGRDISLKEAHTRNEGRRAETAEGRRQGKTDRVSEVEQGETKSGDAEGEREKNEGNDFGKEIMLDRREGRQTTKGGAGDVVGTQSTFDNAKGKREGAERRGRTQYITEEPVDKNKSFEWKRTDLSTTGGSQNTPEGTRNNSGNIGGREEGVEREKRGAQYRKTRVERKKENGGTRRANWNQKMDAREGPHRRTVRGELGGKNDRKDLNIWIAKRAYSMRRERRQREASEEHVNSKTS